MFMKENAQKKAFNNSGNNQESKEAASSWEAPKTVCDLVGALTNWADVYASLWPLDPSPRVMMRVLVHYEFGAGLGGSEKERVKALEEFCDLVLRENARRAILQEVPLSFQQEKERWRDLMEQKRGQFGAGGRGQGGGAASGQQTGTFGRRQQQSGGATNAAGPGAQAGSTGRSVAISRSAQLTFQGDKVCFLFNGPKGCARAPKGSGCDDGRGGCFAHVCNFEVSQGRFCLARHARTGNH
jgi:hypothetical protein